MTLTMLSDSLLSGGAFRTLLLEMARSGVGWGWGLWWCGEGGLVILVREVSCGAGDGANALK